MTIPAQLIDLQQLVGQDIGVSSEVLMDQERIDRFADATGDRQWIHVDVQRARREGPYGETIAHGYLLLSLIASTTIEVLTEPAGFKTVLNYGIDRVRFTAPVTAGSRVRNRIKLVDVQDKGEGRTLFRTENSIEVVGQSKPALVAQALVMTVK